MTKASAEILDPVAHISIRRYSDESTFAQSQQGYNIALTRPSLNVRFRKALHQRYSLPFPGVEGVLRPHVDEVRGIWVEAGWCKILTDIGSERLN